MKSLRVKWEKQNDFIEDIEFKINNFLLGMKIYEPPIDLLYILQKLDIEVIYFDDELIKDGFAYKCPKTNKCYFFINENNLTSSLDNCLEIQGRVAWTIAHEIAHIVLGHIDRFGKKCNLTASEYHIINREADIFARELIMPARWVKSEAATLIDIYNFSSVIIDKLMAKFKASKSAVENRLLELGIVSKADLYSIYCNKCPDLTIF
jgi:Zn-dependent peptidase ImmA (M78 family)